jgi:hypothetical protein
MNIPWKEVRERGQERRKKGASRSRAEKDPRLFKKRITVVVKSYIGGPPLTRKGH